MKAYFFDLDGTLTDSWPGLYLSFQSALKAIGIPPLDSAGLRGFLGTPLPEMFRSLKPDISQAEIDFGMTAFRSTYEREGIGENQLYRGVLDMLGDIRALGGTSWIVTSKPERYAKQVARILGLTNYVSGVIGAGLDETDTKADLVGRALRAASVRADDALMLGDRHYDITGAIANKVCPVGALWGYGSREELSAAGCKFFAESAREFAKRFVVTPTYDQSSDHPPRKAARG